MGEGSNQGVATSRRTYYSQGTSTSQFIETVIALSAGPMRDGVVARHSRGLEGGGRGREGRPAWAPGTCSPYARAWDSGAQLGIPTPGWRGPRIPRPQPQPSPRPTSSRNQIRKKKRFVQNFRSKFIGTQTLNNVYKPSSTLNPPTLKP